MGGKVYNIFRKIKGLCVIHFEQRQAETSWKFHIFRGVNSHD